MKSNDDGTRMVDISRLRIGMFVELDVGWLAHAFPVGSFKLTSTKQIDAIAAMGLRLIRVNLAKSDSTSLVVVASTEALAAQPPDGPEIAPTELRPQLVAKLRTHEQQAQALCERRFAEAVGHYGKALELISSKPELAKAQCHMVVHGFVTEMLDQGESAIRVLSQAAGEKSAMHPINVTVVSLLLGKAMGLHEDELLSLGMAAFLHDVGKAKIPDRVRWLDDSFSDAEYLAYQQHVPHGVQIGEVMALSVATRLAIAQHHEMVDGSGFPARLKGDAMTRAARILSLVNRYDNLCNPSKPSSAMTPHEALSIIFAQFKARFDPVALSAFIRMMGVYPPGSLVQLIDDRYAMVVSVNSARPLKPRIVVYQPGTPREDCLLLEMEHEPQLSIRRSLRPSSLPADVLACLGERQQVSYFFERVVDVHMESLA